MTRGKRAGLARGCRLKVWSTAGARPKSKSVRRAATSPSSKPIRDGVANLARAAHKGRAAGWHRSASKPFAVALFEISNRNLKFRGMPSFDVVSEVDKQEIDNALNQARKEIATRFDLKDAKTEILPEKDKITLVADDAAHLKALREIVIGRLSRRGVDLRNIQQEEPTVSSVGHARQELKIQQGLEGNQAKEIIQAIKAQGFKVQSQLLDRQIRVTGKKKDELQAVIQFLRSRDFGVATSFKNFRD